MLHSSLGRERPRCYPGPGAFAVPVTLTAAVEFLGRSLVGRAGTTRPEGGHRPRDRVATTQPGLVAAPRMKALGAALLGNDILDPPAGCNAFRPWAFLLMRCALGRAEHDANAPTAGPPRVLGRGVCVPACNASTSLAVLSRSVVGSVSQWRASAWLSAPWIRLFATALSPVQVRPRGPTPPGPLAAVTTYCGSVGTLRGIGLAAALGGGRCDMVPGPEQR